MPGHFRGRSEPFPRALVLPQELSWGSHLSPQPRPGPARQPPTPPPKTRTGAGLQLCHAAGQARAHTSWLVRDVRRGLGDTLSARGLPGAGARLSIVPANRENVKEKTGGGGNSQKDQDVATLHEKLKR